MFAKSWKISNFQLLFFQPMRLLPVLLLLSLHVFPQERPNIIYIMSDDHDADAISAYNKKLIQTPGFDRIANEGMLFKRCFVGNSICSPARATLLTGQHSHKNGVRDNRTPFDGNRMNLPKLLGQAGYQTAIVGTWHLHSYPTGFDYWKIFPGMGQYFDSRIISMTGDTLTTRGYATDVVTQEAISWLDSRDKNKPFAFFVHHKAPHRYFLPPLKWLQKFAGKKIQEPSTLYIDTVGRGSAWHTQTMSILRDMKLSSDLKIHPKYLRGPILKPDSTEIAYYNAIMNRIPASDRAAMEEIYDKRGKALQLLLQARNKDGQKRILAAKYQWYMEDYLACVASIDENISRLLKYLDDNNLAKNTIVVYTSDQGMYLGENGWFDKRFMYDVSMNTPLLVRWPGKIKPKTVSNALVQNIDFAPTLLNVAGAAIPDSMQGKSFVPILTGKQVSLNRPFLYYHYYEFGRDHTVIPHLGIRGDRYKLIYFYTVNEWELYDLLSDPGEQKNLIRSAKHQSVIADLKRELNRQRDVYDDHEPAGELH
jgi:arylsulfatase A-like enzyme